MERLTINQIPELFESVAALFAEKKDELCAMDAKMGDGDLGLTMNKGYGAFPGLLRDQISGGDIGKMLMMAGMKMASIVPSTMGTLMSSGIMEGGKALKGKQELTAADLAAYLTAFAAGIEKRGKCKLGDRTILDAVNAGAKRAAQAVADGRAATLADVIDQAVAGAADGVEATRQMVPKYGKAAVFAAKAIGVADQGAVAGYYMLVGMQNYLHAHE